MYKNHEHANRLALIDIAVDVFSDVEVAFPSKNALKTALSQSDPQEFIYTVDLHLKLTH